VASCVFASSTKAAGQAVQPAVAELERLDRRRRAPLRSGPGRGRSRRRLSTTCFCRWARPSIALIRSCWSTPGGQELSFRSRPIAAEASPTVFMSAM
jgi:hypothetical protein